MVIAFTVLFRPLLKADQLLPFHLAILFALNPPAVLRLPPTYTFVPLMATAKTALPTPLFVPLIRADHWRLLPSHLATRLAGVFVFPSTVVNCPPTYASV